MVLTKIVQEIVRASVRYAPKLYNADVNALRRAGWKSHSARGISHGIASGSTLATFISGGGDDLDGGKISPGNGFKANKPDKTRGRQQRNNYRRNSRNHCRCAGTRQSYNKFTKSRQSR